MLSFKLSLLLAPLAALALPTTNNHASTNVEKRWQLSQYNQDLFSYGMDILDSNFNFPFLWQSPKLSSWYTVGLLARGEPDDIVMANKLIANIVTQQDTNASFVGYGTFKDPYTNPYTGDLYLQNIYNSYDPNINLFVTIAFMIIDSQYSSSINTTVLTSMRNAMYTAVIGDGYRVGGVDGDNLYPDYSNPWYMRVASATYVGNLFGDANITYWAEQWAGDAISLFDRYNSISELNGGTYEGVTLFAMSLAQYCPTNSTFYKEAPRLIKTMWTQIAETYNPSLTTLSGPWDRTYGFDLTQYYGILGSMITGIIGMNGKYPMPTPLDGAVHYTDMAMIPMHVVTSQYMEAQIPEDVKDKLYALYDDHMYTTQAISPPWDIYPRNYTYWVSNGLSAGGVEFDESEVGGPSINQPSFSPGVILWDAGLQGAGHGFISYYPTNPSCSIVATSSNLTIAYPPTVSWPNGTVSNYIELSISSLPFMQLEADFLANGTGSLPGLDISLSGSAWEQGQSYLTYTGDSINGFQYYNFTVGFPGNMTEVPTLVISFNKTTPPTYPLYV